MKLVKYIDGSYVCYLYDEYLEVAKRSPHFHGGNMHSHVLIQNSDYVVDRTDNKLVKCRGNLEDLCDKALLPVSISRRSQYASDKIAAFYKCYPMVKHVDDPLHRVTWETFSHIWELAVKTTQPTQYEI